MTERKPYGTSWESWIDSQIRVAQEQGAFDNLPGAGKPIPSPGADAGLDWWVKQLMQREQVSMVPPSLELPQAVREATRATPAATGRNFLNNALPPSVGRRPWRQCCSPPEGPLPWHPCHLRRV